MMINCVFLIVFVILAMKKIVNKIKHASLSMSLTNICVPVAVQNSFNSSKLMG